MTCGDGDLVMLLRAKKCARVVFEREALLLHAHPSGSHWCFCCSMRRPVAYQRCIINSRQRARIFSTYLTTCARSSYLFY